MLVTSGCVDWTESVVEDGLPTSGELDALQTPPGTLIALSVASVIRAVPFSSRS